MGKRRLAFIGLEPDTVSACLSMLKIMEGRSSVEWSKAAPDIADVLIMPSAGNSETQPWEGSDKPRIVVFPSGEKRPSARFSLPHPFRVMQLLNVLDDVAESFQETPENTVNPEKAAATVMDFGYSLQHILTDTQQRHRLYKTQSDNGAVFVAPQTGCYYTSLAFLKQLRQQQLNLPALKAATRALPENLVRRPVFELAWYVARFSPRPLGSWIPADGVFKLKRWPNFGTVRGSRVHLSLCALLTRQPLSRKAILARSQCSEEELDRFLTACDMAGLLKSTTDRSASTPNLEVTHSEGRFGGLIRGLRSRLGLSG